MELVGLLREFYGTVHVPQQVLLELQHRGSPSKVRAWAFQPPVWIVVHTAAVHIPDELMTLDAGERDAISLVLELGVGTLLMDDMEGRTAALRMGLSVIGTLGILLDAEDEGKLVFADAARNLLELGFRASSKVIRKVQERHR